MTEASAPPAAVIIGSAETGSVPTASEKPATLTDALTSAANHPDVKSALPANPTGHNFIHNFITELEKLPAEVLAKIESAFMSM